MSRTLRARGWLWFAAIGGALVLGYLACPPGLLADGLYVIIGLAGSAAIMIGVRLHRPRHPVPWYLMAAGQFVWTVGDLVSSWYGDVLGDDGFPTPADACYLIAYPLLGVGLALLARIRRSGSDVPGALDSATVTVALGLLIWVFLAEPTMLTYHDSPLAALVSLAYPLMDVMLLALLVRLVITPGGTFRSMRLLLLAVTLLVAADSLTTALNLLSYDSTRDLEFMWLLSYLAWGAAALHPTMHRSTEPAPAAPPRLSRLRLASTVVAVLVAPAVLAVQHLIGGRLDVWAVVAGSSVLFLLVLTRAWLALREVLVLDRARSQAQAELRYQATHDVLTGLPNRAEAHQLITAALARAQRSGAVVGLLFIDLDGFKRVNDTLGHGAGDEVLRKAAARMRAEVRTGDVVARLGGDEFVILLESLDDEASAVTVAERLVASLAMPIPLENGRRARIGASVGVALNSDGQLDPEIMLGEADAAVYRAKESGRGRIEVFDTLLRAEVAHRSEIESGLARAIESDELVLHYQPIVSVITNEVEGYEALVRWQRPGHGLLQPGAFLPVAARSDLICELDTWVLRRAAMQLAEWSAELGSEALVITVNVAGRHLSRRRILDDVLDALDAAGIGTHRLILEVGEDALTDDPATLTHLADLRALGVRISMDEFGSGYHSIARLEHLPVDVVKIDRRFLDESSPSATRLLKLIVQAAHAFDLPVVAEGVERSEQLAVLRAVDCESAQGYLLGRPNQVAAHRLPGTVAEH